MYACVHFISPPWFRFLYIHDNTWIHPHAKQTIWQSHVSRHRVVCDWLPFRLLMFQRRHIRPPHTESVLSAASLHRVLCFFGVGYFSIYMGPSSLLSGRAYKFRTLGWWQPPLAVIVLDLMSFALLVRGVDPKLSQFGVRSSCLSVQLTFQSCVSTHFVAWGQFMMCPGAFQNDVGPPIGKTPN